MRYTIIGLCYWPIWLFASSCMGDWAGIITAGLLVIAAWFIAWRIEFGMWVFGA